MKTNRTAESLNTSHAGKPRTGLHHTRQMRNQTVAGGARDCAAAHTNSGRGDCRNAVGTLGANTCRATSGCATGGNPVVCPWVAHQLQAHMFKGEAGSAVAASATLSAASVCCTQAMPLAVQTSTQPCPSAGATTTACDSTGSRLHSTHTTAANQAVSWRDERLKGMVRVYQRPTIHHATRKLAISCCNTSACSRKADAAAVVCSTSAAFCWVVRSRS